MQGSQRVCQLLANRSCIQAGQANASGEQIDRVRLAGCPEDQIAVFRSTGGSLNALEGSDERVGGGG